MNNYSKIWLTNKNKIGNSNLIKNKDLNSENNIQILQHKNLIGFYDELNILRNVIKIKAEKYLVIWGTNLRKTIDFKSFTKKIRNMIELPYY